MDEIRDFDSSLWVDNSPKAYLESTIYIRHFDNPHNTMEGKYTLIKSDNRDLNSTIFIYQARDNDLKGTIGVRVDKRHELRSFAWIKYRRYSELNSRIEAVAGSFLDGFIEVSPHNVMYGDYEVMEAPRIKKKLDSAKDAFTRNSVDYQTVNWGAEKRMMVGRDATKPTAEQFESFVEFDVIGGLGKNKVIEKAVMRLYYQNSSISGIPLEFYTNQSYWSEMGITHVNKPLPKQLITTSYTVNDVERYIEVDLTDIVLKWYDVTETNYGISIKSLSNTPVTFYTKENGVKKPTLEVTMIDLSTSYTAGKAPLDATIFVIGKGYAELKSKLTVKSDIGVDWRESTLYVHRPEEPMDKDLDSSIWTSRPEMHSTVFIFQVGDDDKVSTITVVQEKPDDKISTIGSTVPELHGVINLDPSAHLYGFIRALPLIDNDPNGNKDAVVHISQPEIHSVIEIPNYSYLHSVITVKGTPEDKDLHATIGVPTYVGDNSPVGRDDGDIKVTIWNSTPELASTAFIYLVGNDERQGTIEVYERYDFQGNMATSRPELEATATFKLANNIEATIIVRGTSWLDGTLVAKQISEIKGTLLVKAIAEKEVTVSASQPELHGFIFRRYTGDDDLDSQAVFRARDVADLHCRFGARGSGNGAYYFIL